MPRTLPLWFPVGLSESTCRSPNAARDERSEWLNVIGPGATDPAQNSPAARPERVPAMQRLLDNPFLLLFLGVVVPTVFYIIWGILEIAQIPIAR